MKLRNKQTGEIKEWDFGNWYQHIINPDNKKSYECTLSEFLDRTAEFREEWEDIPEEPKGYWYIGDSGEVWSFSNYYLDTEIEETHREIGNLFETREAAEKAVEKLRAYKRLKDKGFRFNRWTIPEEPKTPHIKLVIEVEMDVPDSPYDLDICFGGEE